ncbi:hypothetical protein [Streptomyces angustmyceticus]|uniref:hypothetical protein n=1 Tax=Streptomyces angustmyceticus TaxID=285578 RepID=UPI0021AE64C1|nr:hypothetical protein [Streptomyces angustmyceticus]
MMRPRLKSDVLYVPTGDGVHVFGAGADLALRGRAAYQWLDRLAPHLDGSAELDDLVGRLPDDKRQLVHALVGQLQAAGCLFDAGEDLPHGLTRRELETYASEIAFIEYHGDSAARRFETYRDSELLVVGAGPVFVSLVCSALRSGVRHLRAVCTEEAVAPTERLAELTAEAAVRDPEQRVSHIAYGEGELTRLVGGRTGAVVHIADGGGVDRALWLDELCREAGTLLVQGLVVDDVAWLGPAGSDWRSAWLRLDARGPFRPNAFLTGPAAAVVASHLGLAAFTALTGIAGAAEAADGARKVTRIDLETLRTSTHAFLPHPAAAPARPETREEFTRRVERLRATAPLDEDTFSRRAARCFDPYVGVLRGLDEGEFTQVPLHVTEAVPRAAGAAPVHGAGTGFAAARRDAALRGLASYAAHCPDDRRYGPGGTVWGWAPDERRAEAVAACRVFGTDHEAGVAARLGWDEAVADGLAQHCVRLALGDVARGRSRPRPVRLRPDALAAGERRLLDLLVAARGSVEVADIGEALGVPVLAWWQGGRPAAVTCGKSAVAEGLRAVLLDRQAVMTDEPAYAPARWARPGVPVAGGESAELPVPAGPTRMVEALRSRGARPLVVPLDHDPAVHEVLPFVVRVVLADGDGDDPAEAEGRAEAHGDA